MKSNKISFVLCTDDDVCESESIRYIGRLAIPDGVEVEVISVHNAASMLAGYREGYESTDSEYFVFMHQDVFILNRFFIMDILSIFRSDEHIGMIGMVGSPRMSPDFIMWNSRRIGNVYIKGDRTDYAGYRYDIDVEGYEDVEVIDGFLMVYRRMKGKELTIRDDIFTGWDFYDVSMSFEVINEERKIVVPWQHMAWCLHDDLGVQSLLDYDKYRMIALKEYGRQI